MTLIEIIEKATKELRKREKTRDEVFSNARKVRMLSKQAILLYHNNQQSKAEKNLNKASELLNETTDTLRLHPELQFSETIKASEQEYTEAMIVHSIMNKLDYPTPGQLSVHINNYILGLADVPGELRRQVLDNIRSGCFKKADQYLSYMEEIYIQLVTMEEASLLLRGLRRKLDIMRSIIERTRSEVINEESRIKLRKQLKELKDKLSK